MNSPQTPAISATKGRTVSAVRILLPIVVLAAGLAAWEAVVRVNDIPPYVLPGPSAVFRTLIRDWPVLSQSLLTTLLTTLEGFVAAALGGRGDGVQGAALEGRVVVFCDYQCCHDGFLVLFVCAS